MAVQQQIETAIQALEAQRALLGDAVVDAAVGALRARMAAPGGSAAGSAEIAQTLKQVTILFLDVVGSTTLTQQLDPEAVSAVLDDALSRSTAIVQGLRGKVLQYAGDNILAAFGVDEAQEDDAERAVQCGLSLLELGKRLGAEVRAAYGHPGFDVRVGIHTGGVLLGGGVDGERTIRGIAVNVAARMEQTAPAGSLRISHETYALVRGMFEVGTQDLLTVKGMDSPVRSYLVRSAKPRNFRIGTWGIEGVATRMMGRDAEFEVLQVAFKRLFAERRFTAVTVVADAGLGKSRLQYEFAAWSEAQPERFFLFRGRATPQTRNHAFGLLRDVLAWRFQIADDDSIEAARTKLEQGVIPLFISDDGPDLAEGHAHLLGYLIGIEWTDSRHIRGILDDPKQIRNRAFHAAAQVFRRVSASDGSPVVMQLEDLHWADTESLDFLVYLSAVNRDVPMLVLATTRPTLFELHADWRRTEGRHLQLDLAPLDSRSSRSLAQELLKKLPEVPAALRELLTSSAEGNPFYMEELLKMLIDQGAIETGEVWKVNAEQLLITKVPSTLIGVLQARLDGLPSAERRALQWASVIGTVFWDQALAAIDGQAAELLPALAQRELTLPRADASLVGLREYAFRHQLLHQVVYDTVLKRNKREGHARVAQWLAGLTSMRAGDVLGMAAEHFEHAGDEANAAEFHARAAEQASQRFVHERVLSHVDQALALLGHAEVDQTELRWRLLCVRERTSDLQGRRDAQGADLDALARLAEACDNDRRRAEVARRRSLRAMRMADWGEMERAARDGLACAARAGDDDLRLQALRLVARALVIQGDIESGRDLAMQGLAQARAFGLSRVEALLLNTLSIAASDQGDETGALELDRQCLQIARETGDRVGEAVHLSNLGYRRLNMGDLAQARRDLEAALKMLRANGDTVMEGLALGHLSALALWEGDDARALSLAQSVLDIAVAAQARDLEVYGRIRLGDAEVQLGRLASAEEAYRQARAQATAIDHPSQHEASAGLARVEMAMGNATAAIATLQSVLEHAAAGGNMDGTSEKCRIELTCYHVLARVDDPRAPGWLARAHTSMMKQALAIADPRLREGLLRNVPFHREIMTAWALQGAAVDSIENPPD